MTELDYTSKVARRQRWFVWPLRAIIDPALLLAVGLLILMARDGHGTDEFSISLQRLEFRFLSNRNQLAFSVEDRYQPLTITTFGGTVPAGAPPVPVWAHNFLDDSTLPQHEDKSSYMIAAEYHPYLEWRYNGWNKGHFKTFTINRPLPLPCPNPPYVLCGCGLVLPTLWIVAFLGMPLATYVLLTIIFRG